MFSLSALLIPFVLGGLIGWIYFTGLWETVRRLPEAHSPYGLVIFSFAARMVFALGGFFILESDASQAASCFLGQAIVVILMACEMGALYLWSNISG